MTERPILFSGPMVQAILRDPGAVSPPKTQTRRVVTPQTSSVLGEGYSSKSAAWAGLKFDHPRCRERRTSTLMDAVVGRDKAPLDVHLDVPWIHPEDEAAGRTWENDQVLYRVRPRIEVGDLLWVRETHMILEGLPGSPWPDLPHRSASGGRIVHYREGFDRSPPYRWRPSIHMPKWAARLWLRVTDVRAQRLHDISEDDILSEGVTVSLVSEWTGVPWSDIPDLHTAWQLGWDHINAARGFGWDTNTWTWAFTFERTEAPA